MQTFKPSKIPSNDIENSLKKETFEFKFSEKQKRFPSTEFNKKNLDRHKHTKNHHPTLGTKSSTISIISYLKIGSHQSPRPRNYY